MKAIFIETNKEEISYIDIDNELPSIYKKLGCDLVESYYTFVNKDVMYGDEEALMKNEIKGGIVWDEENLFFGNLMIVGTDNKFSNIDCKSTIEDIKDRIRFLTEGDINRIIYGE